MEENDLKVHFLFLVYSAGLKPSFHLYANAKIWSVKEGGKKKSCVQSLFDQRSPLNNLIKSYLIINYNLHYFKTYSDSYSIGVTTILLHFPKVLCSG